MNVQKKLLPIILGVMLVVIFVSIANAARVESFREPVAGWEVMAPIPFPVSNYGYAQCAAEPNVLYVVGGETGDLPFPEPTNALQHYDMRSDAWEPLSPLPEKLVGVAATCVDDQIYVVGGYRLGYTTHAFYIYDINDRTWSAGPDLPRPVHGAALGAWNGFLYLVGGAESRSFPFGIREQVDRYNFRSSSWEPAWGAPMPAAALASSVQAGPYLYLVGGYTDSPLNNSNQTMRYDMSQDEWSVGPAFTSRRAAFALAITERYLYAIGGNVRGAGIGASTTLMERLDFMAWESGRWEETGPSLPEAISGNTAGFCTEPGDVELGDVWSIGGVTMQPLATSDKNQCVHVEPCFEVRYDLLVTPFELIGYAIPGTDVSYALRVRNMGTVPDRYDINTQSDWPISIPSFIGPLAPSKSTDVSVHIKVPDTALPGEKHHTMVTFSSEGDGTLMESVRLITIVLPPNKMEP